MSTAMIATWVLFVLFLSTNGIEEPPMIIATDNLLHCHKLLQVVVKEPHVSSASCKLVFVGRITEESTK